MYIYIYPIVRGHRRGFPIVGGHREVGHPHPTIFFETLPHEVHAHLKMKPPPSEKQPPLH